MSELSVVKYDWICYDGIAECLEYFETESEARDYLKHLIGSSLEDGEWDYDIEYSFVAKISSFVKMKEMESAGDPKLKVYDMVVEDKKKMNLRKIIEDAHMAGQCDAEVGAEYSYARDYCNEILEKLDPLEYTFKDEIWDYCHKELEKIWDGEPYRCVSEYEQGMIVAYRKIQRELKNKCSDFLEKTKGE